MVSELIQQSSMTLIAFLHVLKYQMQLQNHDDVKMHIPLKNMNKKKIKKSIKAEQGGLRKK